ncbi:MAG: aminoglycoside phosphotransferase family protein [Candidatus Promineifilaceae bacterium]
MSHKYPAPKPVRLRATSIGKMGTHWLENLDSIVDDLAQQWQLTIDQTLGGGSESLVLSVTQTDHSRAILKIGMPTVCDTANEAKILRLANGRGYATLLDSSHEHNAMLLEHLGAPIAHLGKSTSDQINIICQTLKEAWIPLNNVHSLTTGAEKARWLATFIDETWHAMEKPCALATRNQALAYCEARTAAFDPQNSVLVHGDAHEQNTLQTLAKNSYKFVDPDGLFAEPACDLAVPMRGWGAELLAGDAIELGRARCEQISALTGVEQRAIWQWGFMERVSTGLVLIQIGMTALGREYLQVADLWATSRLFD